MNMKSMKNVGRLFGIVAMVAIIGLAVTACDQASDPAPSQWTVSLIQNHTSTDNTEVTYFVHVNGGQFPASVSTPSARSGWAFTGFWTARSGGTQYFNANGARTSAAGGSRTLQNNLRLYAQWNQGTTPPPTDPGPTPPTDPGPTPPTDPGPAPPPQQPDLTTPVNIDDIIGVAASGPVVFTLGTTQGGDFVELRMTGRTADWHGLDIQFPALIAAGDLSATGTYSVRATGRGGASATGQFMIQGMQPGHDWGTLVPLAAGQPFTLTRNFTMQAGPAPWAGDPRWATARLTTDGVGASAEIIFTSIEILRVPGNVVVFSLADAITDNTEQTPPQGQIPSNLVGTWEDEGGGSLVLNANGTLVMTDFGSPQSGTFSVSGNNITITLSGEEPMTGTFVLVGDTLTLSMAEWDWRLYREGAGGITWSAAPSPGIPTPSIILTFQGTPAGLVASDISIFGSVGSATEGDLTGSGNTWTLAISNVRAGDVTISIDRDGISRISQSVTLVGAEVTQPQLTGTVAITGTAQVGQTLTANLAGLSGIGFPSFQWRAGNSNVGTDSITLPLTAAHVGQRITVTVTRAGHTGSVTSPQTNPVIAAGETQQPQLTGTVTITGTAQVGQTLTADTASLGGSGTISFQWRRGTANIAGATNSTLVLTAQDQGENISVRVTRANNTGHVDSPSVGPVIAAGGTQQPQLTGTVTITGTAQVGQTLTANTANLGGSGTISFQWRRGTANIAGATNSTLVLTAQDQGANISVRVTRANNTGHVDSPSAGPVIAAPIPAPNPPFSVVIMRPTSNSLTVTWTGVVGVTTFEVQMSTTGADGPFATVNIPNASITAREHVFTNLLPNHEYHFRVRSVNSAGTSGWTVGSGRTFP